MERRKEGKRNKEKQQEGEKKGELERGIEGKSKEMTRLTYVCLCMWRG